MSNEALGRVLARFAKGDEESGDSGYVRWENGHLTIDAWIDIDDPDEIAALDQLFEEPAVNAEIKRLQSVIGTLSAEQARLREQLSKWGYLLLQSQQISLEDARKALHNEP